MISLQTVFLIPIPNYQWLYLSKWVTHFTAGLCLPLLLVNTNVQNLACPAGKTLFLWRMHTSPRAEGGLFTRAAKSAPSTPSSVGGVAGIMACKSLVSWCLVTNCCVTAPHRMIGHGKGQTVSCLQGTHGLALEDPDLIFWIPTSLIGFSAER